MKYIDWDAEKNKLLKVERGVGFEDVVLALEDGRVLDLYAHQNETRYPGQKVLVVEVNEYAYLIPFVEDEEKIFLKTIIPSRKATKKYLIKS